MNSSATATSPLLPPPPPVAHAWWSAPYYTQAGWTPSTVPYFQAALVFMTIVYIVETYLDWRQHRKLHETTFPPPLADALGALGTYTIPSKEPAQQPDNEQPDTDADATVPPQPPQPAAAAAQLSLLDATRAKFDSSRAYGLDKSTFAFVSNAYAQLEATALLLLGYLPFMWMLSGRILVSCGIPPTEIRQSIMLLLLTSVRDTMATLPFALYATFTLEARHGFNNQTLGLFLRDKLKAFGLMLLIGFPLTAALIAVVNWTHGSFYLYLWVLLAACSLVLVTLYPILILPLFNTFTPLPPSDLRVEIEALAQQLHFPLTHLFVCDGSKRSNHSNAYFYGLFQNKRIVLFDTLLLQATNKEVVAVLAHELGHWQLAHTLQGFVLQQLYTLTMLFVFEACVRDSALFASFGFAAEKPVLIGFFLFGQTVWAPIEHALAFLLTLHTRRNEFAADAFAVDLGHAHALQSGLTKLALENLSNMNPDRLYSAYHYSHPPLVERLTAIATRAKKKTA